MTGLEQHVMVSIPHSGLLCPSEISIEDLSEHQQTLAVNNVDWHTDSLYDFQDLLNNQQIKFPLSQVYINVNRHPDMLDEAVPLALDDFPIYRSGREPSESHRRFLLSKYHFGYHQSLAAQKKIFVFDGHSTVTGHTDASGDPVDADIIVSDFQASAFDPPGGIRTAPEGFLETYCDELEKRFHGTGIRIARNTTYTSTYGHVMAAHGWDGQGPRGRKAPLLLQETNEHLYIRNGIPDIYHLEEIRRIFAQSLVVMLTRMKSDLI
ncbi:MAG: N-formylglutamate amidohydrolase [Syntrophotaleaceae bacterium]